MPSFIAWVIVYVAIVAGVVFLLHRRARRGGGKPLTYPSFAWQTLNRPSLRLPLLAGLVVLPGILTVARWRISAMMNTFVRSLLDLVGVAFGGVVSVLICGVPLVLGIVGLVYLITLPARLKVGSNQRKAREFYDKEIRSFDVAPEQKLASWGATFEQRRAKIDEVFDLAQDTIEDAFASKDFAPRYERVPWSWKHGGEIHGKAFSIGTHIGYKVARNLSVMSPKSRELLRAVEHINNAMDGKWESYGYLRFGLIWEDGKGEKRGSAWYFGDGGDEPPDDARTNSDSFMRFVVEKRHASFESVSSRVMEAVNSTSTDARLESVKAELRERLRGAGSGGGSGSAGGRGAWLSESDIPSSVFAARSQYAVQIGMLEDGTPLTFSGDESLITIAPPGSGKTQCNVFPTLLRWKGPALVLDISGDIYDKTSKWRSENVGPVYKFSPLDPERSHRWSPLSFVRSNPDYIWEDARLLAELMIVPGGSKDPFWEDNARIFLTAAIAATAYSHPPEARPMHEVLDAMHGGEAWESMMTTLRLAVDVRAMPQHATSIASMEEKTRDSVRQTARASLSAWAGERIARATSSSDWNPMDLRAGGNATVYIVVQPHEVEAYLSLLRVFIGQHIRMLFSSGAPKHGSCPTLVMLDEMPRLRKMPPIDEALNIGRRFGLRLWMFAQSFGQLEEAYENAEGMVASCGVRIYMNPSAADGTAEKLAEQIGYRSGPMDGNRQLIVEPNVLSGAAFKDHQIVLGKGCKPAKVRKVMAWQDPEISGRFGELEVTRTAAGGGR